VAHKTRSYLLDHVPIQSLVVHHAVAMILAVRLSQPLRIQDPDSDVNSARHGAKFVSNFDKAPNQLFLYLQVLQRDASAADIVSRAFLGHLDAVVDEVDFQDTRIEVVHEVGAVRHFEPLCVGEVRFISDDDG